MDRGGRERERRGWGGRGEKEREEGRERGWIERGGKGERGGERDRGGVSDRERERD